MCVPELDDDADSMLIKFLQKFVFFMITPVEHTSAPPPVAYMYFPLFWHYVGAASSSIDCARYLSYEWLHSPFPVYCIWKLNVPGYREWLTGKSQSHTPICFHSWTILHQKRTNTNSNYNVGRYGRNACTFKVSFVEWLRRQQVWNAR